MSIHIGATPGQIASTVLLPGDPLRAKYIAETMLQDVVCFNEVRGMWGYTGRYGDKTVSTMGSGMGMPTLSIYVNELVTEYNVETLIRVGTCGAFQPDLKIGDIVLAMTASTNSHINKLRFGGMDYAFSGDTFYNDDPDWWKIWSEYGALVVEMESNGLYTLGAKFKISTLSILTVSDSLVTGETSTAEQREKGFAQMAEIALEIAA